jgi:hypothetical protein
VQIGQYPEVLVLQIARLDAESLKWWEAPNCGGNGTTLSATR